MKQVIVIIAMLAGITVITSFSANAQTETQKQVQFQVGDSVQANDMGDWKEAIIVGAYDPEWNTYQVHFDETTNCANHRLDIRLKANWVRSLPVNKPFTPRNPDKNSDNSVRVTEKNSGPAKATPGQAGSYKIGDTVMYTSVAGRWEGAARIENYNPDKRQYTLRFNDGSGDIVPCYAVYKGEKTDAAFFVGNWNVKIYGAMTHGTENGKSYTYISGGAYLPPLQINANGTFTWRVSDKKIIRGKWKSRDALPGIVLLKGIDNKDWIVYEKTEGISTTRETRDEIGFYNEETATGYYHGYRIGTSRSCVLKNRY